MLPKLFLKTAALAVSLAFASPAFAQKLNLEEVKCGDWLKAPQELRALTLAWLEGYHSDEDADAVIDFDKIIKNSEKVVEACTKTPDKALSDVAENIMGE